MSNLANAPELDLPEPDAPEPEIEEIEVDTGDDAEPEVPADDLPEIEYKGGKYKVSKEVKEWADEQQAATTRKFQEAAKLHKEAEDRHQTNLAIDAQKAQFFRGVAEVEQINEALAKYEQVDWQRWELDDPTAADRADRERIRLRLRRDDMVQQLRGKAQQYAEYQAQEHGKRRTAAEQEIRTHIKDWSPQRAETVAKAVEKDYGVSKAEFESFVLNDARAARIVHDAFLYRQSLRKASAPQLKTVQTVQQVKGSAPATKDPDKMSITEWNAWMDKQEAKKMRPKADGRRV